MRKIVASVAVAFVMLVGGVSLAACGSQPIPPVPSTWTVSYTDPLTGVSQLYCPYEYSSYETQMYGYTGQCTPVAFPSLSIMPASGTLGWALMNYWTTYSDFYMSNYWYYNYYAPIGGRYHVTLITYASYSSNMTIFSHTYSRQVSTNRSTAKYVGKNGKTVSNYKFPTTNSGAAAKIWSNNSGTKTSGSGLSGTTGGAGSAPRPAAPAPRAPAVGKAGRR